MTSRSEEIVWTAGGELAGIPTAQYWNDEEQEAKKPYDIRDGNVEKLWRFLRESTTYLAELEAVIGLASDLGVPVRGIGIDIAAGVCWTTALLSKIPAVEKLYAVDFSKHRLSVLAPLVLRAFGADEEKVVRVLGSFYQVRLPDASVDFCLLCQAFHHADEPQKLLQELRRVLRPGGTILIMGENPIYPHHLLEKRIRNCLKRVIPRSWYAVPPVRGVWPSFRDLYPPNSESGDHYYQLRDYGETLATCGFTLHSRRKARATIFVGVKSSP